MSGLIDSVTDWVNSKKQIADSIEFLNDFASVDLSGGIDNKVLILSVGNSEIRISTERIEIALGTYNPSRLVIEKEEIFFQYHTGEIVDIGDILRVHQFFFREQPTIYDLLSAVAPLLFDKNTGAFSIRTASSSQSGALSAEDWQAFASKQASSPELAALANIVINGTGEVAVFRSATGSYVGRPIVPGDIQGLQQGGTGGTGSMSSQNADNVTITGGSINGVTIGATNPQPAQFSRLTSTAQNAGDVPLTLNTFTSGADTLQVKRADQTIGFRLLNSGSIEIGAGSFYRHSGNQVVGNRKTGWANPTGTATRTSYATSTVTLSQLAERVKGLIDDLISHGLLGA
jgi:hypothetical protein